MFPGDFANHLIQPIIQGTNIPERLAFFCDQYGIADLEIDHRIKLRHSERNVIWIAQGLGQGRLSWCTMTRLALDILNVPLARMDIAIAHHLIARVTVNAIERVLALRELSDRLVVIMEAIHWAVVPFDECHSPQVVVTAVVTGVALCVWNGG